MIIIANTLIVFGCLIMLFCSLAFTRIRDVFFSIHLVVVSNIYGLSLLLIGIGLQKFSLTSAMKIFILVLLNLVITMIITQFLLRRLTINNILPNAEIRTLDL